MKTAMALTTLLTFACSVDDENNWKDDVTALSLPGDNYYPESVTAAADGTLYVGSLGTGQVVSFAPGATTPTTFLAGGDPKGVSGVFADSGTSTLYLCALDLTTRPPATEVRAYDLGTAALKNKYAFPSPAFCGDFDLDRAGNLYVADTFGSVYKLTKGSAALALWKRDPLLARRQRRALARTASSSATGCCT